MKAIDLPLQRVGREWRIGSAVTGVSIHSQKVQPGHIFVALRGAAFDGHDFIVEAVSRGAVAVVGERPCTGLPVPYFIVGSGRVAAAELAAAYFRHPARDLTVVGVTGTNGKTTVVFWLQHLLKASGHPTGILSSVVNDTGQAKTEATLTTPESPDLQAALASMRDSGLSHAVVEVSSHAIVQHRIDATPFRLGVLTNITREHLDFHGTMERYVDAKTRFFTALRVDTGDAVLNADDRYFNVVRPRIAAPVHAYGLVRGEVRATVVRPSPWSTELLLETPEGSFSAHLPHPGRYNVYNLLAAIAAGRVLGLPPAAMAEATSSLPAVPGRMHAITEAGCPTVIVDYAHTPDALCQALTTARGLEPRQLWVVFGARGARDQGKRPAMGRIAACLADHIVVTTDSPYDEDPQDLAHALIEGIRQVDAARLAAVELDRALAILYAVSHATPDDIVMVTGRGPETTQRFRDERVPLLDEAAVRDALKARLRK